MYMNPVVHFEMPYVDRDRMASFYEKTFGWTMNKMGAEMGDYVVAQTGETDQQGMLKNPGQINGGFYQRGDEPGTQYPSVVIAVADIREAMKKVTEGGGKVLGGGPEKNGEPVEIPGIGMYVSIIDTEGNRVSLLQPAPRA